MKLYSDNLSTNAQVLKLFARHPNAPQVVLNGVTFIRGQSCSIEEGRAAYQEALNTAHDADDWRPVELNDYANA